MIQDRSREKTSPPAGADAGPARPPEKRAAKPVHTVGLNLGLRLYLLLLAIFLPAFFLFYVFALRSVEGLHAAEVDDVLTRVSLRVEDWLVSAPALNELSDDERETLTRELRLIAQEPAGIESATVFALTPEHSLLNVAATGAGGSATKPVVDDLDAAARGQTIRTDVLRGKAEFKAVSIPLRQKGDVSGVLHLEVLPAKIGAGRWIRPLNIILIAGAAGLIAAAGAGVALFFRYAVRRPIVQLTDAMEDAAEGNLSALVDVRIGEFGGLASSYNQMMRRLKQSMDQNRGLLDQIKGFNTELQGKIESATGELAAKNVQLGAANDRLFGLQRRLTTLEKLATLGEIATLIAHELGTPLNAISGHLQLLLEDSVSDPAVLTRLKVIDGQVDRLTNIVRGVLQAMRVPPPQYGPVEVRNVIRDVVDLFSPVAEKRKISVHLKLEDSVPPVQADGEQLQQVFMNLFTNAMDAMKEGGVLTVSAEFVPEERAAAEGPGEGSWVRVGISDTGGGMDEETARRAFEPFFTTRRPDAESAAGVGMGLGLSICRQILKGHYGEITVRSEPGKGTQFTIFLPLDPRARGTRVHR